MSLTSRRTVMARKRYKSEEIVAKLRQVDVLVSQGQNMADAIRQIGVSVSQMTAQKLMTLAQRRIHSLTAIIDHLNKIGAQDELRRISLHLRRLASLIDDARRILL